MTGDLNLGILAEMDNVIESVIQRVYEDDAEGKRLKIQLRLLTDDYCRITSPAIYAHARFGGKTLVACVGFNRD
jgi:hypothetical protein